MITFVEERGTKYVQVFGKRVFAITARGSVVLLPHVHVRRVRWDDVTEKPASGVETVHEQATGTVNGVNKVFASSQRFDCVYVNGLQQLESVHYARMSATQFELSEAPLPGDIVSVTYIQ